MLGGDANPQTVERAKQTVVSLIVIFLGVEKRQSMFPRASTVNRNSFKYKKINKNKQLLKIGMYTASKTCTEEQRMVGLYDDEQVKIAGFVGSF